jgi:hypothetical protein
MKSPVKSALQTILGSRGEVRAYHLSEDFNELWTMGNWSSPLIIVWQETPPDPDLDPIHCENVLSPLDWAVAYTAAIEPGKSWPNILIVDVQPHANIAAPLYRRFREMRPELFPWLHVHAAPDICIAKITNLLTPRMTRPNVLRSIANTAKHTSRSSAKRA